MTRCLAISFDVWGTLLDLEATLKLIAKAASALYGFEENYAVKQVMRSHEEARSMRRLMMNMSINELLEKSREILAKNLGISKDKTGDLIGYAFEFIANNCDKRVVYADVVATLPKLMEMNVYMGVIGNVLFWPSHYTRILLNKTGLSNYMNIMLFSDEIGYSKPDRAVFLEFSKRSGYPPDRIIHVGDSIVEDIGGALSAGSYALLINRNSKTRMFINELRSGIISDFSDLLDIYNNIENTVCKLN